MENLIKKIKQVKGAVPPLHEESKEAIRNQLTKFMNGSMTVRVGASVRHNTRSPLQIKLRKLMPIILALALLLSGGATVAAQHAEPGDVFYPVKVGFLEEARAHLSLSTEAKANWEAHRAEERLKEAQELEVEGKLNTENRTDLEERFDRHVARVKELIAELRAKGNTQAAISVEATLEAAMQRHLDTQTNTSASVKVSAEDKEKVQKTAQEIRDRVHDSLQTLGEIRLELKEDADDNEGGGEAELRGGDNEDETGDDRDTEDDNRDEDDDHGGEMNAKVQGEGSLKMNGNGGSASTSGKAEIEL